MSDIPPVLCQRWEDFFPSFGRIVFGYSLHLSEADLAAYKPGHIKFQHKINRDGIQPSGEPYWTRVDDKTISRLRGSGGSLYIEACRTKTPLPRPLSPSFSERATALKVALSGLDEGAA
jgi:hypothetical protein